MLCSPLGVSMLFLFFIVQFNLLHNLHIYRRRNKTALVVISQHLVAMGGMNACVHPPTQRSTVRTFTQLQNQMPLKML